MGERTVWIKGFVPKAAPKTHSPYAVVDFPVGVETVDPSEASVFASIAMPDAAGRGGHDLVIEVMEWAGKLWRPVMYRKYHGEGTLAAEEALARNDDNPIAAVARSHCRQSVDESAARGGESPALAAELAARIARAAEQVCIIGETAYRECHEPTWVVTEAKYMTRGVLLQPYLGVPGHTQGTAWFSYDRLAEAEGFATEVADGKGTAVVRRGDIDLRQSRTPDFDDVAFAEDRVLDAFTRHVRILSGTLPEEISDMADNARRLSKEDRAAAVGSALEIAAALGQEDEVPGVSSLLSSAEAFVSQVDFFRRNAVFSRNDDEALDSMRF